MTLWTAAHQAFLSTGFFRQEYWRGLPWPPPGDLPNPGIEQRSPTSQADSLPSEPPGKPKNTGEGNPFLLQGIFLIQELNRGLLHCRWLLYQLSYPESPLVWLGCPSKVSETRWLQQQKLRFSQFWRLEGQAQGAGRFDFFFGLSAWLADGLTFTMTSRGLYPLLL